MNIEFCDLNRWFSRTNPGFPSLGIIFKNPLYCTVIVLCKKPFHLKLDMNERTVSEHLSCCLGKASMELKHFLLEPSPTVCVTAQKLWLLSLLVLQQALFEFGMEFSSATAYFPFFRLSILQVEISFSKPLDPHFAGINGHTTFP